MRNSSWNDLTALISGKSIGFKPVGFIIDSPWIPGWYGISSLDYYTSDDLWLRSNLSAAERFPDVWFMPGFWSEYGMCSEPSAFGSRMVFSEFSLPHAERIIKEISEAKYLPVPDVKTDGLLPFMINRLKNNHSAIREADHEIRFAVSRGPFNIASFLMGTTEFMMSLALDPEGSHRLIEKITDFVCNWLSWQRESFPTIDGILLLDDLIGFVGDSEFDEFVTPYFRRIFSTTGTSVRFLHNDADGLITARNLKEMGVNMFNFSHNHSIGSIQKLAGREVFLVGNIPPRDVLAEGKPEDVSAAVTKAFSETSEYSNIIWSAGGGMPPGVKDENILAFIRAVRNI